MPRTFIRICGFAFLLSLVASSCAHSIARSGFDQSYQQHAITDSCAVTFASKSSLKAEPQHFVGRIKLKDSGFSTRCDKSDALEFLKAEACSNGANFVVLSDEKEADIISSCYRCTAELYSVMDTTGLIAPSYTETVYLGRNKPNTTLASILSFTIAFALGFGLTTLILQ